MLCIWSSVQLLKHSRFTRLISAGIWYFLPLHSAMPWLSHLTASLWLPARRIRRLHCGTSIPQNPKAKWTSQKQMKPPGSSVGPSVLNVVFACVYYSGVSAHQFPCSLGLLLKSHCSPVPEFWVFRAAVKKLNLLHPSKRFIFFSQRKE